MSGLVAVASRQASDPGVRSDVEGLADAYVRLRDEPRLTRMASPLGEVVTFGQPGSGPVTETEAHAWAVLNGAVRSEGSLPALPLADLDGQFALVRHPGQHGPLEIATDPFGMHALSVAERGGRVFASTSGLALAAHLGAPPDRLGMLTFLRTGIQFGART